MPIDRRLRDALPRIADVTDLDVESDLESTLHRADPPRSGLPMGQLLAAAMAVLVIVVGIRVVGLGDGAGVDTSPRPSPAATDPIAAVAGAYTAELGAEVADPDGYDVTGSWTLTLRPDGTLDIAAPTAFTGSRATGHAYSVTGTELATDLWYNDLCDAVGRYRWTRDGAVLELVPIDDPCTVRATVLSASDWVLVP